MKTVMLIKLHSGMDSSTFADRFNYEGCSQIGVVQTFDLKSTKSLKITDLALT